MAELTSRRKADRVRMAAQVADLAGEYGLSAVHEPEQGEIRRTWVDVAGPHGLKLTVKFDGTAFAPDTYVLNWHGVEDGTRLHPGMFGIVNQHHGHKATDVARGFGQLTRILRERFAATRNGSAFVSEVPEWGTVTDYSRGTPLRPATREEWQRTADVLRSNAPGSYTGAWDDDGRAVYVDGGPEAGTGASPS